MPMPSRSKLYRVWEGIKQRCLNPKNAAYKNYGGRGIGLYAEWLHFAGFRRWAERAGYRPGLDIDRINNDGPYCPSNCRFVTRSTNMANTRVAVCHSYWGERLPLKAASRKFGVDTKTIRRRMDLGMTAEQAVSFKGRAKSAIKVRPD